MNIVRAVTPQDFEEGRLEACLAKRVGRLPPCANVTTQNIADYLKAILSGETGVVLVADDGQHDLAGIFACGPVHMIGEPTPTLGDFLEVSLRLWAFPALVAEAEKVARHYGCKNMLLTCETTNMDTAERWGAQYNAKPMAVSLLKELPCPG